MTFDNLAFEKMADEVRQRCRIAYRDDGTLDNPYTRGTLESLVWTSEASRIEFEYEVSH